MASLVCKPCKFPVTNSNHISKNQIKILEDLANYSCFYIPNNMLLFSRHLARNPFHCDCHIKWIVDWLAKYPVETSGARCEGPKRMHKKKLGSLRAEQLKCYGKYAGYAIKTYF